MTAEVNSRPRAAIAAFTAVVQRGPDGSAEDGGFVGRALAAQPRVPAWIAWLFERAGEQLAQVHYPPSTTPGTPTGTPPRDG
ncbi:hypothetical protein [Nocardia sp. NPDC047038]|uniref:hypothetical protein n=1 Tax=Nocardia sp. NPDC047038 TaxID=3154338 RepID=UPI0033EAC895